MMRLSAETRKKVPRAADQGGEGDGPIDDPAALRHHPLHGVQRDAERHHADLLFLRVIHRHEHPQRRGQRAAVDGAVDVAFTARAPDRRR